MKTTGEIMIPLEAFPYIPYWFSLRQALAELSSIAALQKGMRLTPWVILVFDAQSRFLGLIQREDILRGLQVNRSEKMRDLFPTYITETADSELSRLSFSSGSALNELQERLEHRIIEFMASAQITVNHNDSVLLAIRLMIERGLTFVPVEREGQIVGILDIEDVLTEVVAGVL